MSKSKPKVSITIPRCPHCDQAAGCTKNRGAYHSFEHDGYLMKLYHVTCKGCEQVYTLKEAWPLGADPAADQ
jgi:hypothetical protein